MIILLSVWLLMAAAAILCGLQLSLLNALLVWIALVVLTCAGGARLISRQPIGIATLGGRFGSSLVHWGFRVSRGQLIPAAEISGLIWILVGGALISGARFQEHRLIIVSWMGDGLALLYVLGAIVTARQGGGRAATALGTTVLVLVGLIAGSAFLWFHLGTDGARAFALAVAGGPPFFVGVGYGAVLATELFAGQRRRTR
jgi:hypothetical protein